MKQRVSSHIGTSRTIARSILRWFVCSLLPSFASSLHGQGSNTDMKSSPRGTSDSKRRRAIIARPTLPLLLNRREQLLGGQPQHHPHALHNTAKLALTRTTRTPNQRHGPVIPSTQTQQAPSLLPSLPPSLGQMDPLTYTRPATQATRRAAKTKELTPDEIKAHERKGS